MNLLAIRLHVIKAATNNPAKTMYKANASELDFLLSAGLIVLLDIAVAKCNLIFWDANYEKIEI